MDDAEKIVSDARAAAALPKPTLDEMIVELSAIPAELAARECVRISVGYADAPSAIIIRRIVVLDALVAFLDAVKHRPRDVARRLNSSGG